MPKDKRTFITVAVDMPDHPKFASLSKAQKFLIIEAWCHCRKYTTDGFIDLATWRKMDTKRNREAVEATGILVPISDGLRTDCEPIPEKFREHDSKTFSESGVLFLDFLEHQQSRAEIETAREAKKVAGSKGGKARAANLAADPERASRRQAGAKANAKQTLKQNEAEEEEEEEKELTYVSSSTHLGNTRAKPRTGRAIAEHLNGKAHSPDAHTIARAYSDSCQTPIAGNTLAKIAQAIDSCLTSGIDRTQIETGIHDWAASPMTAPSTIPDFVHKAANRPAAAAATNGVGKTTAKAMGWANLGNQLAQQQAEALSGTTTTKGITA